MKSQQRNLNPSAEAIAAMYIYTNDYAEQSGGSMDFWDNLSERRKHVCIELVDRIRMAS